MRNQTRINFYSNILTLVVNVIIVLTYTPYLVNQLGVAVYGVLPLALIINQYIGVVTSTLTHSFTRFYSVSLQKKEYLEASKVVSTSLLSVFAIILVIIPFLSYLVIKVDIIFQIPKGLESATRLLFIFTILSFFFSIVSSFLNVTLYAENRLDTLNYLKIIRQAFKLIFVIVFFELVQIDIMYVGLANLFTEILVAVISVSYFLKFKPLQVQISKQYISKTAFYAILGMSLWILLQEIGDTFIYRTDNLLINHYLGADASGRLGAMSELGNYIKLLVNLLGSLFGPLILIAYSRDDHNTVKTLTINQGIFVGCIASVMCGVVMGVSGNVLTQWMNSSFAQYYTWLDFKLVPVPFYATGIVLSYVYRAWNKVKFTAILTIVIGLIDLALTLLICNLVETNQLAIVLLALSMAFSIIQSYFLGVYCICNIYPECKNRFVRMTLVITMMLIVSYILTLFVDNFIDSSTLIGLLVVMTISGLSSFVLLYFVVLERSERNEILSVLVSKQTSNK